LIGGRYGRACVEISLLFEGAEELRGRAVVMSAEPGEQGFEALAIVVANGDES
jgi:hypothetical protein